MRALISITMIMALTNIALADKCEPTPHRTTGNHYKPVTEQKINVSKGVIVRGRILAAPNCTPVPNAKIAHWQGGEQGRYENHLYAYMFADEEGRYEFETEWPNMSIPHIHFIVTSDGYQVLETQWVGNERQKEINFDMVLVKKQKKFKRY